MAMSGNKTQDSIYVAWNVYRTTGLPPTPQTLEYFPTSGTSVGFGITVRSDVAGSDGDITNVKVYINRTNTSGQVGTLTLKKESTAIVSSGTEHTGAGFNETPSVIVYDGYIYLGLRFVVTLRSGTIITIDQNPVGFINSTMSNTPTIAIFTAKRCDTSGVLSDEGTYIRDTIEAAIAPGMGWDEADHTLRVGYRLADSEDVYTWISKTGFTAAIDIDEKLDTAAAFLAASAYEVRCELINNERSITTSATVIVPKAFANLHLSGTGVGVAIGQFSTSTEEEPKLESAYPIIGYDGFFDGDGKEIIPPVDYSTSRVDTGLKWTDGKTIYRKVLTFTSMAGSASKNVSLGETAIAEVVDLRGMFKPTGETARAPIPWAHYNSTASQFQLTVNNLTSNPYVNLRTGSAQNCDSGFIVIDYTLPTT